MTTNMRNPRVIAGALRPTLDPWPEEHAESFPAGGRRGFVPYFAGPTLYLPLWPTWTCSAYVRAVTPRGAPGLVHVAKVHAEGWTDNYYFVREGGGWIRRRANHHTVRPFAVARPA